MMISFIWKAEKSERKSQRESSPTSGFTSQMRVQQPRTGPSQSQNTETPAPQLGGRDSILRSSSSVFPAQQRKAGLQEGVQLDPGS